MEQLEDNLATFSDPHALSKHEEETLFKALDIYKKEFFVPCTACRYCTSTCPSGIDIPAWMSVYNDYKVRGGWAFDSKPTTGGTPADCIGCGACEGHCPQDIIVPQIMAELASKLS